MSRESNTNARKARDPLYSFIRELAKERDGFACQKCKSRQDLSVHHKIPYKTYNPGKDDIDNLITLCRKCHDEEDLKLKRKKRWRR